MSGVTRKARIHVSKFAFVAEELDAAPDFWHVTGYPDSEHVDVEIEFEHDSPGEKPGPRLVDLDTGVTIFEWL